MLGNNILFKLEIVILGFKDQKTFKQVYLVVYK